MKIQWETIGFENIADIFIKIKLLIEFTNSYLGMKPITKCII